MWRGGARWWFSFGEVVGGALTGLGAVLVGALLRPLLPRPAAVALIIVAAVALAVHDAGWWTLRLPQNARQVPQLVVFDGRSGPLQFGVEMGTGLRTYMTSSLPHLALLGALLLSLGWQALLVGAAFGTGRATMALTRLGHQPPERWDATYARRERPIRAVLWVSAVAALVVVGAGGS